MAEVAEFYLEKNKYPELFETLKPVIDQLNKIATPDNKGGIFAQIYTLKNGDLYLKAVAMDNSTAAKAHPVVLEAAQAKHE